MKPEEKVETIIDFGITSNNEKKIKSFLYKLNKISFSKPEIWEKELFEFFGEINFVPYIILTSTKEQDLLDVIKSTFFKSIIGYKTVLISTNEIYRDLIKIYESIKNEKNIKDYLEYFFNINHHLKKILVKRTDEEDTRFKEFGVGVIPICYELKTKEGLIGYEQIYFILPDNGVEYPIKDWTNDISKKWRIKLKNKYINKKINTKKRDPIESRLRHEVFKRDNYKCVECGKTKEQTTLHCDHILPVAQGGSDELDNLQTLCQSCNLAKSNRKWKGGNIHNEKY